MAMLKPKKKGGEPKPCSKAGDIEVEGGNYCGMHAEGVIKQNRERRERDERMTRINQSIDEYIAWTKDHPSVWDSRNAS